MRYRQNTIESTISANFLMMCVIFLLNILDQRIPTVFER